MATADFKAKLTTIINAEPDHDEDLAIFWCEFMSHHEILAATPDPAGVMALSISDDADSPIKRACFPWADIEADFLDVDAATWRQLSQVRRNRQMLSRIGEYGFPTPW